MATLGLQHSTGAIGDMDQLQTRCLNDVIGNLMHGVGGNHQAFCPARLEQLCGMGQIGRGTVPIALLLPAFDQGKVNRPHQQIGAVQATEASLNPLIDQLIIVRRAFPTHTAQNTQTLHL